MRDWQALHREMATWRHELHAHPEFGFGETRTAAFVAEQLRSVGMDEVVEGIGGTGVSLLWACLCLVGAVVVYNHETLSKDPITRHEPAASSH
jgi:hypothetical protein